MNEINNNSKILNSKLNYFITTILRWYLAYYMFMYGYDKMIGGQFGISDSTILNKPLNTVSPFYISWYLFSLEEPFKYIVGIFQIIGSILIVIEPLALFGALFLLPIIIQIFLIDVSFVKMLGLNVRVFIMILCDFYILYTYKEKMINGMKLLLIKNNERSISKYWYYPIFLVCGFLADFVFGIVSYPVKLLIQYFWK